MRACQYAAGPDNERDLSQTYLGGGEGSDHDESSRHSSEEPLDSELLGEGGESGDHALSGLSLGLVHSGEERVGRLGDGGGGETGDNSGSERVRRLLSTGELGGLLARHGADVLERDLEDGELGHRVGDLLEQDGSETGVEAGDSLLLEDSGESSSESVGERRLGHESDSDGLERAEGNVGEELGDGGGSEVDGLSVLSGSLDTVVVDGGLLPELVTSELERSLDRVSDLKNSKGKASREANGNRRSASDRARGG